jgi:hypothetical protein
MFTCTETHKQVAQQSVFFLLHGYFSDDHKSLMTEFATRSTIALTPALYTGAADLRNGCHKPIQHDPVACCVTCTVVWDACYAAGTLTWKSWRSSGEVRILHDFCSWLVCWQWRRSLNPFNSSLSRNKYATTGGHTHTHTHTYTTEITKSSLQVKKQNREGNSFLSVQNNNNITSVRRQPRISSTRNQFLAFWLLPRRTLVSLFHIIVTHSCFVKEHAICLQCDGC